MRSVNETRLHAKECERNVGLCLEYCLKMTLLFLDENK